ncbi:Scavenger receptor cysteine-rich type 1 protein M160 [Geodia barretti]|uniref:Scavenger receptor cysteine-rich type 1 protein M160 n=1 Tax=Geodia barretti TaxID=519541 RepID=A0AA35S173_GEOBA|nr:Scavenger receptor cysteine-rich type 1 protein M160 [Geodia barretti]
MEILLVNAIAATLKTKLVAKILMNVPMNISNCMENSVCKNTEGSFYCMCNPGYFCGEDGNCPDIDECECGTHDCDENADCTNIEGSYMCTCIKGYIGDGRNCTACNASTGIRLVHGNETSGLVEVLRNNCEWRSVCDDFWTDHDAKVACGQLGFLPYAAGSYRRGRFENDEEVQYWLDDVQCTGDELSLFDCQHKDTHNCGRRERAGVHCLDTDDVAIRLIENITLYSGIIELRIRDEWRSVCHDKWTDENAQVACRSMGLPFTGAKKELNGMFETNEEVKYWLSQVNCRGEEESLLACLHSGIGTHNCGKDRRAKVICKDIDECECGLDDCDENANCTNTEGSYICTCREGYCGNGRNCTDIDECELGLDDCDENVNCTNTEGSYICTCREGYCGDGRNCTVSDTSMGIRLVDGNETSGLVEVLRNCEWRSVCDDYWTDHDAKVACGQLGFLPYAAGSYRRGKFENDEEVQYWLDDVLCTGNEVSLFDCPHKDTHNCGWRERAGVHCLGKDDVEIGLVENTTLYSGIIDLKIRNESRSVCHDQWTDEDAQVACRSMGLPFTGAEKEINGRFEPDEEVTYWLSQVSCRGDEESLLACRHSGVGNHDCGKDERAKVICKDATRSPKLYSNGFGATFASF